jgi:tetratricopeptide (TPR) repeat protein
MPERWLLTERSANRLALALLCGALLPWASAACTTKTVKPVERRIVNERTQAGADGDKQDVAEELQAKLDADPSNPKWYFELGSVHELRRDYERAEELYRRGLQLIDPGRYTGPDMALGRVLIKRGRLDQALEHLHRVISVKPRSDQQLIANSDYRDAYYLMGAIYYNEGEMDRAEAAMRSFLRLGGDRDRVTPYFPTLVAEGT